MLVSNECFRCSSISGGGLIGGTRHGGDAPGIGYGEPRNVQFVVKVLF